MDENNNVNTSANNPEQLDQIRTKIELLKQDLALAEQIQRDRELEIAPLQSIYTWEAPNRVYSEKNANWYGIVSLVFIIGIAVAVVTQEYLLVIALISLMILLYISNTIPPKIIEHEITNKGLRTNNTLYTWDRLRGFWFSRRNKQLLLIVDLNPKDNPNRLLMLVGTGNPSELAKYLLKHAPYLQKGETGEDIISAFTLGDYARLDEFIG